MNELKKIRIVEQFMSIQGEGKFTGTPSYFVRSAGCNLRCPGFSVDPKDPHFQGPNQEVAKIIEQHKAKPFKCIKECPLAKTGCDSYPASYPEFATMFNEMTVDELVAKIGKETNNDMEKIHLVITGGEPLLHQNYWMQVIEECMRQFNLKNVTFETNGTIELNDEMKEFIYQFSCDDTSMTFSVSPKLSCAGNKIEHAWKPKAIKSYVDVDVDMYFKFVVGDIERDIPDIEKYLDYINNSVDWNYANIEDFVDIYLMPVGGMLDEKFIEMKKQVAQICIEKRYKFSDRLHLALFGNKWET